MNWSNQESHMGEQRHGMKKQSKLISWFLDALINVGITFASWLYTIGISDYNIMWFT